LPLDILSSMARVFEVAQRGEPNPAR